MCAGTNRLRIVGAEKGNAIGRPGTEMVRSICLPGIGPSSSRLCPVVQEIPDASQYARKCSRKCSTSNSYSSGTSNVTLRISSS